MGIKIYNKLVRDRIPQIIEGEGKKAITRQLDEDEYKKLVFKKLIEEAIETESSVGVGKLGEELADLLEVIDSIMEVYGLSESNLKEIKDKKALEKGRFKDQIFLESVEE